MTRHDRSPGRPGWLLAGALAAMLVVVATAGAVPTWLAPQTLSQTGGPAQLPSVALGGSGDAVAVWQRFGGEDVVIQAAARPAGGAWSPPETVSEAGQSAGMARVAVDRAGTAVAVWERSDGASVRIQAAVRPAGGPWEPPETLSAAGVHSATPQVALDAAGGAVAVWRQSSGPDTVVHAAVRPAGGPWGTPEALSAPGGLAFRPQVAVDPAGAAVAVWDRLAAGDQRIQAAVRPAGGAWGAAQDLSEAATSASDAQVALDAAGDAVVVWDRFDGAVRRVQAAVRPAGGAFGAPVDVSGEEATATAAQVAVDPAGNAVAAWTVPGMPDYRLDAAARPAGGPWGPVETIAQAPDIIRHRVAMSPAGGAVAVWQQSGDQAAVRAASRPPAGPWGPPVSLTPPGADDPHQPEVAVDAAGNALAAWTVEDPVGGSRVQAAGHDAAGPVLTVTVPETAVAGRPAEVAVAATDVWSALAAAPAWSFGDGGTATGSTASHEYRRPGTYSVGVAQADALGNASTATAAIRVAAPPPGPAAGTPRCPPAPAVPAPSAGGGRFTLAAAQLRINQRIGQAAIRRLNAISDWLDAGILGSDLCGGAIGSAKLAPGILTAAGPPPPAEPAPPAPRPVTPAAAAGDGDRIRLSAQQLLINQRIYQAAVRRANALTERLAGRLTGGDLAAGALAQDRLAPGLRVLVADPAPSEPPASRTEPAAPAAGDGGVVRLTVSQLAINQRVAQAAVRRANALMARLAVGLTGSEFADGSITARNLAPAVTGR